MRLENCAPGPLVFASGPLPGSEAQEMDNRRRGRVSAYRVYVLDENGHVLGPPNIVVCDDDAQAAHRAARYYLNGKPIEVWDEARRVVKFNPPK